MRETSIYDIDTTDLEACKIFLVAKDDLLQIQKFAFKTDLKSYSNI